MHNQPKNKIAQKSSSRSKPCPIHERATYTQRRKRHGNRVTTSITVPTASAKKTFFPPSLRKGTAYWENLSYRRDERSSRKKNRFLPPIGGYCWGMPRALGTPSTKFPNDAAKMRYHLRDPNTSLGSLLLITARKELRLLKGISGPECLFGWPARIAGDE